MKAQLKNIDKLLEFTKSLKSKCDKENIDIDFNFQFEATGIIEKPIFRWEVNTHGYKEYVDLGGQKFTLYIYVPNYKDIE